MSRNVAAYLIHDVHFAIGIYNYPLTTHNDPMQIKIWSHRVCFLTNPS